MKRAAVTAVCCLALQAISATPSLADEIAKATAAARRNFIASGTKMARAYQRLLSQTRPEARPRLRASQSAWTKFRDAECQYEIAATGATAFNKEWSYECLKGLTEDRAWRLDQQLHCPGVDGVPCKTRN